MPFKLLSNKTTVFVTPVLIHIFTLHQQMADTLSLLVLDQLHTIMRGMVIEITVAGASILQPNFSAKRHCDVGRHIQMLQRNLLA